MYKIRILNYLKIHNSIIERAKNRVLDKNTYIEKHHIVPRCINGSNDQSNIVKLLPEEHFVIHQLLIKIYPGVRGLIFAAIIMTFGKTGNQKKYRLNNKRYSWLRRKHSKAISKMMKGVCKNEEHKEKLRKPKSTTINMKKPKSKEHIEKVIKAKRKPIKCLNNNIIYSSITEAAEKLGLYISSICKVLKNKYKHTSGYRFEYVR